MLKDKPRLLAVLNRVAKEADWGRPMEEGRGRGISLQESFGSIVGQVVEVTVSGGKTWVDRVVAVIDAGYAVSPDGTKAQIEIRHYLWSQCSDVRRDYYRRGRRGAE